MYCENAIAKHRDFLSFKNCQLIFFFFFFFEILISFAQNIGGYPQSMLWSKSKNQRTNGPVNAHLRSVVYTNKHV